MAMELDYRASHDGLTELYNRAAWFKHAEKLLAQNRGPVSLLFADIDHFKRLNDRRGHTAGDALLREVARILRESSADRDLIGRFGGDEFVLLLPQTGYAEAVSRAARIEATLVEYSDLPTVSIGIAEWQLGETLDDLIHRADEAMFEKKASRVVV
jgi:diguanylate cyclase (GGDEF)-like protein